MSTNATQGISLKESDLRLALKQLRGQPPDANVLRHVCEWSMHEAHVHLAGERIISTPSKFDQMVDIVVPAAIGDDLRQFVRDELQRFCEELVLQQEKQPDNLRKIVQCFSQLHQSGAESSRILSNPEILEIVIHDRGLPGTLKDVSRELTVTRPTKTRDGSQKRVSGTDPAHSKLMHLNSKLGLPSEFLHRLEDWSRGFGWKQFQKLNSQQQNVICTGEHVHPSAVRIEVTSPPKPAAEIAESKAPQELTTTPKP